MAVLIRPMLCQLHSQVPSGGGWSHELKYDGVRCIAIVQDGKVRLQSRSARTDYQFPELEEPLKALGRNAVLDGEVVALDDDGKPNFNLLQNRGRRSRPLTYVLFDVLELEGVDLTRLPLVQRRSLLEALTLPGDTISLSPTYVDGEALLAAARKLKFEGIVSKRLTSVYSEGSRPESWRKIKCNERQEMALIGYDRGEGWRERLGALYLAYREDGRWVYAGKVGTGFNHDLEFLMAKMEAAPRIDSPFPGLRVKEAIWVQPELVAEIEFSSWSAEGKLRFPSYKGLRIDKDPMEVTRERAA